MTPEPLPPDIAELVGAERARPGLDAGGRAALFARLAMTLTLPTPGGPPPGAAPSAPAAPAPLGPAARAALSITRGRAIGALLTTFLAGGLVGGAAMHGRTAPATEPRVVVVFTAAPAVAPAPTARAQPVPSAVLRVADLPDTPASTVPVPATSRKDADGSDPDLASERALLEVARAAVARGDESGALGYLDEHARRFPAGRMSEEREALRVGALARAGREVESNERRAAFHRRYPKSLVLPPSASTSPRPVDLPTDAPRNQQ